ncbi:MAG: DUF1610 domain-containing protein, partial [Gammaproteobacteria bacterium]|nr:DUF1610 domain-containing protein [Gammaproteobacteria bacterium]
MRLCRLRKAVAFYCPNCGPSL